MAKPPRGSDLVSMLRGLARVGSAAVDVRSQEISRVWATSSLRPAVVEGATKLQEAVAATVQQPQTLQKNASKSASEALARMSMVTEGLKAYRSSSVQPREEKSDKMEDPMYDPSVEELNIEEMLMQEASSGSGLDALDSTGQDTLGRVHEEASNIIDRAKSTREEVNKRVEEFEPFINIAKGEQKEITQEHLQVLNKKVSEMRGIAYGQNIINQEESEYSSLGEDIVHSARAPESAEHMREVSQSVDSSNSQGLSIEGMIMQEAMSGSHDQLLSDGQKYLYGEVQGAADAVKEGMVKTRDEVNRRLLEFEPLLDVTKSEEQEITDEQLEVIDEKLTELHDVSFGQDLKIFREIEIPKPVEEVLEDIVTQQASTEEKVATTIQETEEDLIKSVSKENPEVQTEGTHELAAHSMEATAKSEEKETTQESVQVSDEKVLELQGILHDQNAVQGEVERSRLEENTLHPSSVPELAEHTSEVSESADSSRSQGLSIDNMLLQEAMSGSHEQVLSESQKYLYEEVQKATDAVKKGIDEIREGSSQRVMEFEPLLEVAKSEQREITEEHLEAISEKVSELHDVSFGHDLKMFREIENPEPVEVVVEDIVSQQASMKEQVMMTSQGTRENELIDSAQTENSKVQLDAEFEHSVSKVAISEPVEQVVEDIKAEQASLKEQLTTTTLEMEEKVSANGIPEEKSVSQPEGTVKPPASNLKATTEQGDSISRATSPKPVEIPLQNVVTQQTSVKDDGTTTRLETEERDLFETESKDNSKAQTENVSQPAASSQKAVAELEDSITQVAKPVTLDDSYTLTATEVKADVQVDPVAESSQVEKISSTEIESEGASSPTTYSTQSSSPSTLNGSEVAAAAAVSSMAAVAAVPAAAAAVTPRPTISVDSPATKPEAHAAPAKPKPKLLGKKPLAKEKPKSTLSENAKARKVPHSRFGRLVSFGGLAAGLGVGTLAEVTRRSLGLNQGKGSGSLLDSSPFLTEANAKRIVDTLCRVRGAALKLGQMLSIQDSALINPQLQKIFERVRQSADFMPAWQLEEAIKGQLGEDWRSKVATFDEQPFAAASIGQVHLATLHDGRSVAMKIQYPGVAEGIESDINNLVSTLKVANIFPEGLFVDSVIEVAKRELRWECDYVREVECTKRFKEMVKPYPEFYVPEVIPELCTPQIFTSELIAGIPVDKCIEIDQDSKNYICKQVLRMCLMELFEFGFMQTDPNWSNFFYNAETEQVALLDFGACRAYSKEFVDKYLNLIYGAAMKDRQRVLKYSQELGFLTGYEAKVMVEAHIDAIMILGEAFQEERPFRFGDQNTTHRIQNLVPVMLSHRMCAPPEESYSLHRKMSGVFLLCTKLNGTVNCYNLFHEIYKNYKFGGTWEDIHAGRL